MRWLTRLGQRLRLACGDRVMKVNDEWANYLLLL